MKHRARDVAVVLAVVALCAVGCNAILGNEDGAIAPRGEAGAENDVGAAADAGASSDAAGDSAPQREASCDDHLADDPKNCGRCGHDCLSGGCQGGACAPFVLAADAGAPGGRLVAGDEAAYVLAQDALYRFDFATGALARVYAAGASSQLSDVALGRDRVVFGEIGGAVPAIRSCPRSGGCLDGGVVAPSFGSGELSAARDGGAVAWVLTGGPWIADGDGGAIQVANDNVLGLSVDDRIYWGVGLVGGAGIIRSVALDAGDLRNDYDPGDAAVSLFEATPQAFYVAVGVDGLRMEPRDGGASVFLAPGAITRVRSQGNDVFWLDSQGIIHQCTTPVGCTPRTLNNRAATAFDVNATKVVWIENSGRLMGLVREGVCGRRAAGAEVPACPICPAGWPPMR